MRIEWHVLDTSLLQLEGKSVLVVGGGQGIGESTAKLLARVGCRIAVVDVVQERADRVAAAVAELGQPATSIVGNVLKDGQAKDVVERAERDLGGLDALVTTIGQASFNSILDMTPEEWDRDHRRNLRHFFFTAQAVARSLISRGKSGSMVCISSVGGMQSTPNHASYGAAKAGLIHLVRTMAVEWAPHNIRVNAVAPGSITTPRIPATQERVERTQRSLIPTKRLGTSDEVGKAALFLLSDLASYVTGHTLLVDGGWMAAYLLGIPHIPPNGTLDATAGAIRPQ